MSVPLPQYPQHPFKLYKFMSWNGFDLGVLFTMLIAVILRFVLDEDQFSWARTFYVICLFISYLRIIQSFYSFEYIGRLLLLFKEMVNRLKI